MRARKGHTETQEQELAASLQLNLKQTTPMLGGWGEVGRTQRESEIVLLFHSPFEWLVCHPQRTV